MLPIQTNPPFTSTRLASGLKEATDNQSNTRHAPRRLTQVDPSPVRRTDASARSRWKRGRSVRVARGRSGPRPPAAPAGPRQTHSSHAIAGGGGGEVHPPAASFSPDSLFGPELLLTQGDIAEGDVVNVTWTGSSILSRGCSTVSLLPLKRVVPYQCKAFRWVTTETYSFQITPNLSPGPPRIGLRFPPSPTRVRPAPLLLRLLA